MIAIVFDAGVLCPVLKTASRACRGAQGAVVRIMGSEALEKLGKVVMANLVPSIRACSVCSVMARV